MTTENEEKFCSWLNQGLCKNKSCKSAHKLMSEQQKKDTGYNKCRKDFKKKTKIDNETSRQLLCVALRCQHCSFFVVPLSKEDYQPFIGLRPYKWAH